MRIIPKLQRGDVIASDNTKVVRPEVHEPVKAKPRQYSIVDLGGEPSDDNRSAADRNKDYWHPIKGAKARFKSSMSNETNPLVGIERTILPSAAGAALVTTPAAVVGGALGNTAVDKLTGGWGEWLEDKTGLPSEIGVYTNPGAWYGGAKGYKIGKNKLLTKSIKGDADLAWNPINKNHWIFNKEARTPSNIVMATANRIAPFLSKVEKLPLKVAAYNAAKRTNGNASVSMQDIKTMPAEYTDSAILGGGNLEGRNLLAKYIFDENPIVRRAFFNKDIKNIKPISKNESKRSFSHGDRYEQLYPGIHNRRYEMRSVVPQGRPLKFKGTSEFTEYAGKSPVNKILGKEGDMVMRVGDNEFMTFRTPGINYVGRLVKFQMDKGKLKQTSQDMWKFNPADYAKRWGGKPVNSETVRVVKQAALMDKVGRPFILQQSNPIWIEGKSIRDPKLVTMAHGGRFDFKKSPILKKQEELSGKRDMRKKFIKSSRPTYKKRIRKGQTGMRFVSYNPVSNPTIDYTDITNPINPFSEYNYNTTYDKPEALVVPVRDTNEPDVVANNPTAEPVINKPVASKSVTDKPVTANSTWKSPYTNRKQWSTELINAYKKAGITNDNAIRMLLAQDALESSWGRSAQGKYNFGNLTTGSSWKGAYVTGNDKNAKGEAIKQKFRSYNSMDEYAADKIQFLKRLYDFDENDDINKFVAKLTGSNKGKRRYAEATNYAKVLTGVYNGIPKGENGMIIKYQNPAHGIARRDAIKDYRPDIPNRIRRATPAEHIQSMINIYGQSEQPTVTSDAKSPWQHQQAQEAARKGYDDYMQAKKYEEGLHNLNGILTFTDYATLATGLGSLLSKGASMAGKQMAKRAVGKEFKRQSKHLATPANNSLLVDMSGVTPRPLSEFSSLSDAELAKLLPDYAHPNWQGNGFKLVKERLWNGGFDRLEKYGDISRYSPSQRTAILNSTPKIETSATLGEQPGTGLYRQSYSVNRDVIGKLTDAQAQDVGAHELVHYMYRPSKEQEAELAYNVRQYFKRPEGRDYFRQSRATEQTARGTQIKNYYGLNEGNQDITPAMWEYARRNYVKDTGITNNMSEWLNSVDERDISAFVKWLSNNAPVIAAPLVGGTLYDNK
jgi:flagellum-specific peptidoglycan hydrolase FlgJ